MVIETFEFGSRRVIFEYLFRFSRNFLQQLRNNYCTQIQLDYWTTRVAFSADQTDNDLGANSIRWHRSHRATERRDWAGGGDGGGSIDEGMAEAGAEYIGR